MCIRDRAGARRRGRPTEVEAMSVQIAKTPTQEKERKVVTGWLMLPITIALYVATPVLMYYAFVNSTVSASGSSQPDWWLFWGACVALFFAILSSPGFFTLQPNEVRVLILFGDYRGTCKQGGFHWGNPFWANGPAGQSSSNQPKCCLLYTSPSP